MPTKGSQVIMEVSSAATFASGTWSQLGNIVDISPPTVESDDIETSHMMSPEQFKEFMAGWADGGEAEVTIQYEKEKNTELFDLFRKPRGFRISFADAEVDGVPAPSGSRWKWNGYIKAYGDSVDREDIITTDMTVKVSGKPEWEEI